MTDTVPLHFTDEGAGAPLLLVHGWTCDSYDWSMQFESFEEHHRVIAVDLRGHGRSPVPESGYNPHRMADDLAAVLDDLDCGPVTAIGHSFGGLVVAALAVEHPSLVNSVVEVDPTWGVDTAGVPALQALMAALDGGNAPELAAQTLSAIEGPAPAWLRRWHGRRALSTPAHVVRDCMQGTYFVPDQFGCRAETEQFLRGVQCPTLSFYREPEMAAWQTGLNQPPGSHVVAWEGVGHWMHQTRAAEFNSLVLDWLSQTEKIGDITIERSVSDLDDG